eukprot:g15282.t1
MKRRTIAVAFRRSDFPTAAWLGFSGSGEDQDEELHRLPEIVFRLTPDALTGILRMIAKLVVHWNGWSGLAEDEGSSTTQEDEESSTLEEATDARSLLSALKSFWRKNERFRDAMYGPLRDGERQINGVKMQLELLAHTPPDWLLGTNNIQENLCALLQEAGRPMADGEMCLSPLEVHKLIMAYGRGRGKQPKCLEAYSRNYLAEKFLQAVEEADEEVSLRRSFLLESRLLRVAHLPRKKQISALQPLAEEANLRLLANWLPLLHPRAVAAVDWTRFIFSGFTKKTSADEHEVKASANEVKAFLDALPDAAALPCALQWLISTTSVGDRSSEEEENADAREATTLQTAARAARLALLCPVRLKRKSDEAFVRVEVAESGSGASSPTPSTTTSSTSYSLDWAVRLLAKHAPSYTATLDVVKPSARGFCQSGAVSLLLAGLGSEDEELRQMAATGLSGVRELMEGEGKDHAAAQEQEHEQEHHQEAALNPVLSVFLAKSCEILRSPEHPLYRKVGKCFNQAPFLPTDNCIQSIFELFFLSDDVDSCQEDKRFLLSILKAAGPRGLEMLKFGQATLSMLLSWSNDRELCPFSCWADIVGDNGLLGQVQLVAAHNSGGADDSNSVGTRTSKSNESDFLYETGILTWLEAQAERKRWVETAFGNVKLYKVVLEKLIGLVEKWLDGCWSGGPTARLVSGRRSSGCSSGQREKVLALKRMLVAKKEAVMLEIRRTDN